MKKAICIILSIITLFLFGCEESGQSTEEKQAEAQKEIKSGEITIYSLKDDTLCPILTDNEANRQMLCVIYEALVRVNEKMEAEGVLATKWSVSEDGLVWIFELRDDVKWHSGEDFTPYDVVYTVEQIRKNPGSSYESNIRHIDNMTIEDNKIIFSLNQPCANFVNLMTFPIVRLQGTDIDRAYYVPNGTGAYIFSDKHEGNMYYLLRNEKWWGGHVKEEEIRVKLLPDSETVMYSLSAGDIDIANSEREQQGRFVSNTDVRAKTCPTSIYNFVGINHKNEVLQNKEVRRAMDKAINRKKIIDDIVAGNGSPARSPMRENWFINDSEGEDYNVILEDAERLLQDGEWKKSHGVYCKKIGKINAKLELELIVNEDNANRVSMAENVKLDLESIGMLINVVPLPYEEYESRIASGKYELFIGSVMISEEMDYRFFLGQGNIFRYENEQFYQIMDETQLAVSKEDIIAKYRTFRSKFNLEIPIVGLYFENFDMLLKNRISGDLNSLQNDIYNGIFNLEVKGGKNE